MSNARSFPAILGIALIAIAVIGGAFLSHWQTGQQIRDMPMTERRRLYDDTTAMLSTVCQHAVGPYLEEHCRSQSQFLARFPECDANCERLCRTFAPRPRK